ncbi:hypothetical protein C8A03DRAFT_19135 [Achaetomium macrosporum]|uniref:Uncharacterized protein n=1 Tax=Achaetomium macrosporum TaxID=79813 RepID=A0AAN7C2K6_9PEZI|nr:hypothetical protein C8A03DRAFT_19135 [Achaetomium macrosporum]
MKRHAIVIDKPAGFDDRNERQRKAAADDELFLDAEINDRREVCRTAQEERSRAWQSMKVFIEEFKKRDFNQIWLDLCRDDQETNAAIRSYFRDYVESSQKRRAVVGEQEYEIVQTITATKTVITHWKNLVAEADNTVLREMHRKDPDNRGLWKLRWDQGEPSDRPVADISAPVERFNLTRESKLTFAKVKTMVETTADDLLILLDTLWTRAEDVPCQPQYRVSLHWTLILAGFGFRPGSLMKFRDPENHGRTTLAATITVTHDKRHKADPRAQESVLFGPRLDVTNEPPCSATLHTISNAKAPWCSATRQYQYHHCTHMLNQALFFPKAENIAVLRCGDILRCWPFSRSGCSRRLVRRLNPRSMLPSSYIRC